MSLAAMVKVGELVMYGEGRKSRLHTPLPGQTPGRIYGRQ